MSWRDRVTGKVLPLADAAARAVDPAVLHVQFDWFNSIFLVIVPDDWQGDDDEIDKAVRAATGVAARVDGLPCYPYSLHIRRWPGLVNHTPVAIGRPVQVTVTELSGLRSGFEVLRNIADQFPRCATFAMGGLPVVSHLARLPQGLDTSTDAGVAEYEAILASTRAKFHVHEGLLWEVHDPNPTVRFYEWLALLPPGEPLLLVDTTFSGGGINKLFNAVCSAPSRPTQIEIHGLLDLARTPEPPPRKEANDRAGSVRTALHGVPRLITEDAAALVGYDSIRHLGGLQSRWDSATVEVIDDGEVVSIIGTSNLAHTISELLRSVPAGGSLDEDYKATSAYMAVLTQLDNELRRVLRELDLAERSGLVTATEADDEGRAARKRVLGLKAAAKRALSKRT